MRVFLSKTLLGTGKKTHWRDECVWKSRTAIRCQSWLQARSRSWKKWNQGSHETTQRHMDSEAGVAGSLCGDKHGRNMVRKHDWTVSFILIMPKQLSMGGGFVVGSFLTRS